MYIISKDHYKIFMLIYIYIYIYIYICLVGNCITLLSILHSASVCRHLVTGS